MNFKEFYLNELIGSLDPLARYADQLKKKHQQNKALSAHQQKQSEIDAAHQELHAAKIQKLTNDSKVKEVSATNKSLEAEKKDAENKRLAANYKRQKTRTANKKAAAKEAKATQPKATTPKAPKAVTPIQGQSTTKPKAEPFAKGEKVVPKVIPAEPKPPAAIQGKSLNQMSNDEIGKLTKHYEDHIEHVKNHGLMKTDKTGKQVADFDGIEKLHQIKTELERINQFKTQKPAQAAPVVNAPKNLKPNLPTAPKVVKPKVSKAANI